MGKRGERKWALEVTLVMPHPTIRPFELELVEASVEEGFFFEVSTEEMTTQTLYQLNELVSRLCDCEVMVIYVGEKWSTICVMSATKEQARRSMEDASLFFTDTITWEEHPREN